MESELRRAIASLSGLVDEKVPETGKFSEISVSMPVSGKDSRISELVLIVGDPSYYEDMPESERSDRYLEVRVKTKGGASQSSRRIWRGAKAALLKRLREDSGLRGEIIACAREGEQSLIRHELG